MAREDEKRELTPWNPFADFDPFESFPLRRRGWPASREAGQPGLLSPALDVHENEKSYVVTIELAGANKEDVSVELHDGVLTIRGEKRSEREETNEKHRWLERSYGSFSRSIRLPAACDENNVKASFKDGVLTVEVPKAEEAKPRVISIHS